MYSTREDRARRRSLVSITKAGYCCDPSTAAAEVTPARSSHMTTKNSQLSPVCRPRTPQEATGWSVARVHRGQPEAIRVYRGLPKVASSFGSVGIESRSGLGSNPARDQVYLTEVPPECLLLRHLVNLPAVNAVMNAGEIDALTTSIQYTRLVSYVGGMHSALDRFLRRLSNCGKAGSIAILVYDTLITLDQEIRAVWQSKWNYPRLLYVLTRYSCLLEAGVIIALLTVPGDNYTLCSAIFQSNAWLFVFGLATGELIMTIRTWAVWEKKQAIKYILIGCYVLLVGNGLVVTGMFVRTLEFAPNPRTPYIGCYATRTDPIIFVSWIMLLVYDTLMFILMAISAFRAFRQGGSSRLVTVVYQDGLSYYLYLFGA
ncbi:hypothetical protein D9619_005000 [Psilocybe cf. subviscida]|uniref:DUF6533 domain-containing protein n=1 Tax=Psilocybe cf. subviscida TaxID=2480587 RepID=A0A8H5BR47_9AGAR|nr:hypothetical protein D9619_005000 [Psilocybe cf. subviscida]